jgi:hypothetical protein
MMEHIDAYALGTGRLQQNGKVDERPKLQIVTLPNNTGRVRLRFDQHEVDLEAAARAALDLAATTTEVYTDHVNEGLTEWVG